MQEHLDGSAVNAVAELARGAAAIQEKTLKDGRILAGNGHGLKVIYDPEADSWPEPLHLSSLSGMAEYIGSNTDGLELEKCLLHVVSPTTVRLISPVMGPARQRGRHLYVEANAQVPASIFGAWKPVEEMMIALQTRVKDTADRKRVLKLLGNVEDKEVRTQKDDGVSQRVTVNAGPELVDLEDVPSPVNLAPYRTFTDITDPPISPFILRVRSGGRAGVEAMIAEADGGAWMQVAVDMVKWWLAEESDGGWPRIIG